MLFDVTYEIITPESAEYGDADERGFYGKGLTLREAISALHDISCNIEASCYPVHGSRWVTAYEDGDNFSGARENRSLHFPDKMTDSSKLRVMRLLGATV